VTTGYPLSGQTFAADPNGAVRVTHEGRISAAGISRLWTPSQFSSLLQSLDFIPLIAYRRLAEAKEMDGQFNRMMIPSIFIGYSVKQEPKSRSGRRFRVLRTIFRQSG
jgi:hypothetical protein